MTDIKRFQSPLRAPLSKAVVVGGFLFLSGQTPKNADLTPLRGSIQEQTRNVIEAIQASLSEFGVGLEAVVRCTCWLSDIGLMGEFNSVYEEYFGRALPVRSTVEARLSNDVGVEIEVTCWVGQD